jgi:hypothetical protein
MGKHKDKSSEVVQQQAQQRYQTTLQPSTSEQQFSSQVTPAFQNAFNNALATNTADYGNIMGAYGKFRSGLPKPTKFSYQTVKANRPAELGESYGYLRETMPGYREFAETGGYSPTDIQELRARGISPIRSAYSNTMMELNRARALGGAGGAPNYIAALSRAQREMPEQMANAMTGVNAQLAQDIRQGRLAGLGGMAGVGGTMGGLSSAEAGRMLQAAMANQSANLQAQGMSEQSRQANLANQLASIGGQASLYGTTPGMASTFGNQALDAWRTQAGMEQARNQFGLGLLDAQLRGQQVGQGETPWWQTALNVAGTAAPYVAMAASSRDTKKKIKLVKNTSGFAKHLKELPLYTWQYKGDNITHFGPIAEEFKEKFGVGDGKTLHLADVMGVVLAAGKEAVADA